MTDSLTSKKLTKRSCLMMSDLQSGAETLDYYVAAEVESEIERLTRELAQAKAGFASLNDAHEALRQRFARACAEVTRLSGEPASAVETAADLPGDGTRRAAFNAWWQEMWKDNDPRSSPGFDEQMRSWSLDAWQAGAAHERDRISAMRPVDTNYAHISETMDICSPVGSRIVFANPRAGWPADVANANRWLVEGQTYTISRIDICNSITRVWLKELPDYGPFNSVQFRNEPPLKADGAP